MPMKVLAAALLGSALIAAPALSQQASPPAGSAPAAQAPAATQPPAASPPPSQQSAQQQPASSQQVVQAKSGQWRASKLVGLNVYNQQNEKIGDISELITDQSGKLDIIVVGVGGFLGMGEHRVGLQWNQVKFVNEPARVATSSQPATTGAQSGQAPQRTTTAAATSSGPRDYPDHAVVNMNKDQLKALPAFRYASDAERAPARSDAPAQRPAAPAQPR